MKIVNIIHRETDTIEYLYISLFFKLFGVSVYNSVEYQKPSIVSKKYSPNPKDIINIIISDSTEDIAWEFEIFDTSRHVIISRYGSKVSDVDIIKFPHNAKSLNECSVFFKSIYEQFKLKGIIEENDSVFSEIDEMIKMYIDCNLLDNFYLSLNALRNKDLVESRVNNLYQTSMHYNHYIEQPHKERLAFAAVNLQYLINRVCNYIGFFPKYNWKDLIKEINIINRFNSISPYQITLLSALILDESNGHVDLMIDFYKSRLNEYTYYAMYRLARVYEFRIGERQKARVWLERSVRSNKRYYRSVYKLGVYSHERYDYEHARKYYDDVLSILDPVISNGYWQPREMAYYLKTCGRLLELNGYFDTEALCNEYSKKAEGLVDQIKKRNNQFISRLCEFLGDTTSDLKQCIYINIELNANEHMKAFFDAKFYNRMKFSDKS